MVRQELSALSLDAQRQGRFPNVLPAHFRANFRATPAPLSGTPYARPRETRFVFERPAEGGAKSRSFVRTVYDVDGKLGFQWSRPPGDIVVTKVAPGSWAERSGIAVGLALVRVDGVDTATLTAEGLQATMRQRPLEMAFERRKKARRPPQESSDFVNWAYGFFAGPEDDG